MSLLLGSAQLNEAIHGVVEMCNCNVVLSHYFIVGSLELIKSIGIEKETCIPEEVFSIVVPSLDLHEWVKLFSPME